MNNLYLIDGGVVPQVGAYVSSTIDSEQATRVVQSAVDNDFFVNCVRDPENAVRLSSLFDRVIEPQPIESLQVLVEAEIGDAFVMYSAVADSFNDESDAKIDIFMFAVSMDLTTPEGLADVLRQHCPKDTTVRAWVHRILKAVLDQEKTRQDLAALAEKIRKEESP